MEECRNAGPSSLASVDRRVCYPVVVVGTELVDAVVVVVVVVLQLEWSQPQHTVADDSFENYSSYFDMKTQNSHPLPLLLSSHKWLLYS